MTILLAFLGRAWPYILGLILLGVLTYKADHWCNTACRDARAEAATLAAEKRAAQDRATALALLWAQGVEREESILRRVKEKHDATIQELRGELAALRGRTVRLSSDLARLSERAVAAANAAGAATPAQVDNGPAQAVPELPPSGSLVVYDESQLGGFVVDAADAYGSCRVKLRGCIDIYNAAREAQERVNK